MTGVLTCPFCDFTDSDSYFLIQHVEFLHSEGDSPFVVREDSSNFPTDDGGNAGNSDNVIPPMETGSDYVECPHQCGEAVPAAELSNHIDFHIAEGMALEDAGGELELSNGACNDAQSAEDIASHFNTDLPKSLRNRAQTRNSSSLSSTTTKGGRSLRDFLLGTPSPPRDRTNSKALAIQNGRTRRLGRAELGPHAHEKQMPSWLRKMLEDGARVTVTNQIGADGALVKVEAIANETPGLVPVLARLSELDPTVERAYYSNPEVRHIAKMPKEGGFCGYRNIQMLISYLRGARAEGHKHFPGKKIPSILRLQDIIEQAWEMGFNSTGRIETGGIKGTRKYIGTPEAQALFLSLGINCEANAFTKSDEMYAHERVLIAIGEYFRQAASLDEDNKVEIIDLPPIYFQHQGHSLTVVGLEMRKSGDLNLVVFDPMFKPSQAVARFIGRESFKTGTPQKLMQAFRRGHSYLSKYRDFELLKITPYSSTGTK